MQEIIDTDQEPRDNEMHEVSDLVTTESAISSAVTNLCRTVTILLALAGAGYAVASCSGSGKDNVRDGIEDLVLDENIRTLLDGNEFFRGNRGKLLTNRVEILSKIDKVIEQLRKMISALEELRKDGTRFHPSVLRNIQIGIAEAFKGTGDTDNVLQELRKSIQQQSGVKRKADKQDDKRDSFDGKIREILSQLDELQRAMTSVSDPNLDKLANGTTANIFVRSAIPEAATAIDRLNEVKERGGLDAAGHGAAELLGSIESLISTLGVGTEWTVKKGPHAAYAAYLTALGFGQDQWGELWHSDWPTEMPEYRDNAAFSLPPLPNIDPTLENGERLRIAVEHYRQYKKVWLLRREFLKSKILELRQTDLGYREVEKEELRREIEKLKGRSLQHVRHDRGDIKERQRALRDELETDPNEERVFKIRAELRRLEKGLDEGDQLMDLSNQPWNVYEKGKPKTELKPVLDSAGNQVYKTALDASGNPIEEPEMEVVWAIRWMDLNRRISTLEYEGEELGELIGTYEEQIERINVHVDPDYERERMAREVQHNREKADLTEFDGNAFDPDDLDDEDVILP